MSFTDTTSVIELERLFPGNSEMSRRMCAFDWSKSDLGSPETWPQNLCIAIGICLTSRFPMHVWWGPSLTLFYNDAYISFLGRVKHPSVLGRSGQEAWPELWDTIGPMIHEVFTAGNASWSEDILMFFDRELPKEEIYATFSFSPVFGESNKVEGMFCACTETTEKIIGNRRLDTLRKLGIQATEARTESEACITGMGVVGENPYDIPFAAIYLVNESTEKAYLVTSTGFMENGHQLPQNISFAGEEEDHLSPWPLATVLRTKNPFEITDLDALGIKQLEKPWPDPVRQAIILPIHAAGHEKLAGLLIVGVSPRLPLNETYHAFFGLVAGHIANAIADARSYEEERKRAEALLELDHAKTAFFSNISHEFRTPLTLMLGPLEDELQENPNTRERLEIVYRNSLRLLKLVNTLLDFSRIEAGRIQAVYEPTDLSAFTSELASVFRSAVEKAGMSLKVDCPPLPELIYVDRDMWEKIVLNLLSNAFKFTLEGEIIVCLNWHGDYAELNVKDTGTGIADEEMPRLFERFHRIRGAQARTHEGTGIGLALVLELVKLHGGDIKAASKLGEGTLFTITIPKGFTHLPQDRIGAARTMDSTAISATPYIEEALKWLPEDAAATQSYSLTREDIQEPIFSNCSKERARVLLADDNADMRSYIRRLLNDYYDIEAVADGNAALVAIKKNPPDLVLTDIMMPGIDGIELLHILRADPDIRTIPVILLSARAGEESKVEGLEKGADDYLIKPFSARELIAKIGAQIGMARIRREAIQRENKLLGESEVQSAQMIMKDEFLSIISHEFKTPLTVINSAVQAMRLICRDELSEKGNRFLNKILQNSNRQLKLVNNLLDITRINAGSIKIYRTNVDIVQMTRSITESIMIFAEQKGIRLSYSSSLGKKVIGIDEEKYERILLNLLSNAMKFTMKGKSIFVRVSQKIVKGKCKVCIRVKDQGIGIPHDKQQLIFERFGQVDSSLSRQAEGTGIGLSLVKMLVEIMGGEITLESTVGKGCTFTLLLPVTRVKETPMEKKLQEIPESRLIQATAIEFSDIYQ